LKEDYFRAIRDLVRVGAVEVFRAKDSQDIRTMLGIPAIAAGTRTHARFLLNYFDKESLETERLASEVDFR